MTFQAMLKSDVDEVFLNREEFAEDRRYFHGQYQLTLTVIPDAAKEHRLDQLYTARMANCVASVAALSAGGLAFLPTPGDTMRWTDERLVDRRAVVFPLVNQKCYAFTDGSEQMVRLFAVDESGLATLRITLRDVPPFNVQALLTIPTTTGERFDTVSGEVTIPDRRVALILRNQFPKAIGGPERTLEATEVIRGVPDDNQSWNIDLAVTRWGEELVTLGLERTPLVAMGELRRGEV